MSWTFSPARETFQQYRREWDCVNRIRDNHILLDSRFVEPLLRNFGSEQTLLAIRQGKQEPSLTLIEPGNPGFWQTFQPGQSPVGSILLDDCAVEDPLQLIRELIRDLPGYALGFSVTQQDPDFTCFANLNGSPRVETLDYIQTPRLTVKGGFEDYWKQRSKNLTHNLGRQRRRLKQEGWSLELVTDRKTEAVAECIREYGRLESMGWKGAEGTAVTADNAQGRFYREIFEEFCNDDEGVIYRLLLNGKTVASDLCLERGGTLVILKTAYDESVQGLSLGLLLHQEIFEKLFNAEQIRVIEFYGRLRDWHTKWTNEIRTMYHINFYRSAWTRKARRLLKASTDLWNRSLREQARGH